MEDIDNYDLPMLLKLEDLDIWGVAAKNRALSVTEYFSTLTKFLEDSPRIMDDLDEVIKLVGNEKIFQNLTDMKSILSIIGCDRLVPFIDSILNAWEKGDKEVAAIYAKKVSADFFNLYSRTKKAEKAQKISKFANKGANKGVRTPEAKKNDRLPLKVLLDKMEYEENNRKLRILAVDDASFMLSTITSILKNDYEVFSLTKGSLVEKFLQHTTPELFLLDYTMPEINGFDLVSVIRSFEEHEKTPIIFLTAMGTAYHVSEAYSLGACDYVVKPVNADILREKIAKHIVRKKAF